MSPRVLLTKTRNLRKSVLLSFLRFQSQDAVKLCSSLRGEELDSKGLLRVSGPEVKAFLQGLSTNDIQHLENGRDSIYSAFLNIKGRIIQDTIIYKTKEDNVFLIECDISGLSELEKHLKIFKVRKKIDINDISNEVKVCVVFNKEYPFESSSPDSLTRDEFVNLDSFLLQSLDQEDLAIYKDPRLSALGTRILVPSSCEFMKVLQNHDIKSSSDFSYCTLRYRLGVGEGASELPLGKCFPHETNCDFLHGISFHKGCYIGQEVTSRTQHTGVVRKRLMPLIFSDYVGDKCAFDTPITDSEKGSVVGKIRGVKLKYGLALLRISEALEAQTLEADGITFKTFRPHWWPIEVPKEKFNIL